ncbi:MAG: hypothetical protein V5A46_11775 [Haloferacaceae archaeon]
MNRRRILIGACSVGWISIAGCLDRVGPGDLDESLGGKGTGTGTFDEFRIAIRDGAFSTERVTVPADRRIDILVDNADDRTYRLSTDFGENRTSVPANATGELPCRVPEEPDDYELREETSAIDPLTLEAVPEDVLGGCGIEQ